MRAFLAVELSEEARKECSKIIEQIKKQNIVRANFVKPENLHLTLKFLGEISDKEVEMTKEALSVIDMEKFKVKLGKIGFFSPKFVKVLWIELLSDEQEIFRLQEQVENALADIFPREKRKFQSHVTLARIKSLLDKQKFIEIFEKEKIKPEHVEFSVSEFILKASELTPKGPIYKDFYKFKLS